MPPLNEGSIMDMPSLFPGVGTGQAKMIVQQRDAALARIPEVHMVLGKIGRAETATDMAPMSMIETIAILKEKSEWRHGVDYDSIVAEANATVKNVLNRSSLFSDHAPARRWAPAAMTPKPAIATSRNAVICVERMRCSAKYRRRPT